MEWLEAVVHTTTFGSDLVSDEMMALGAAGCEIVDRADVPDPRQPGVYWELYDPAMIDAMPDDVLVKAWFERGEKERETIDAVRAQLEQLRAQGGADLGTLRLELSGVKDEGLVRKLEKVLQALPHRHASGRQAHLGGVPAHARGPDHRA